MKIAHICMCDPYAEGWSYHRNALSKQNAKDGHQVYLITSQYTMDKDGFPQKVSAGQYTNEYNVHVIRLRDKYPLPVYIQSKIRIVNGLYNILLNIQPDAIMVHNIQFFSMDEVIKYKKNHPNVHLYGDTHADYWNSGRNFISRKILNGIIYKAIIKRSIKYFDRFFYITLETKEFFGKMYGIDTSSFELTVLCCELMPKKDKELCRKQILEELSIPLDDLLFVHSGKLGKGKKTKELLKAFSQQNNPHMHLVILGSIPSSEKEDLDKLINSDKRITFLGWKDESSLKRYIAASDLYLQPGTQSVTMMNALACGTPVMVFPHRSYQIFFNGCEFAVKNYDDICNTFQIINDNPDILRQKSVYAYEIAHQYIDSHMAAKTIFGGTY